MTQSAGLDRQAIAGRTSDFGRSNFQAERRPGFSGDVRHEGPCLSTHSEISLAPRADAFIFVPATVHDWATVVLGRAPTLSSEFVTHLRKLVDAFANVRLLVVFRRLSLFQPAWARCARFTGHAAHLL